MATRFEDLRIWQEARTLNRFIFGLSERLVERRRFSLENQLTRASLSIMNNIAEGFDRGGNREFKHFLIQSKGSTGEVKSMLYVLLDEQIISESEFDLHFARFDKLSRGIHRLIDYLRGSDFEGTNRRETTQIKESTESFSVLVDVDHLNEIWDQPT